MFFPGRIRGILLSPTLLPSTRPMLYNRSADLLPAPPFSGYSVGVSAVASGPFNFAFKRDGSSDGPCASSVHPNFPRCVSFSSVALSPVASGVFSSVVFPRYFFFSSALDSTGSLPQLQVR